MEEGMLMSLGMDPSRASTSMLWVSGSCLSTGAETFRLPLAKSQLGPLWNTCLGILESQVSSGAVVFLFFLNHS